MAAPWEETGDTNNQLAPWETAAEKPTNQDGALTRGAKNAWNSIKTGSSLLTGDVESAARLSAERDAYRRANPGTNEGNELMQAWESGDGVMGGISNVAGEVAKDWREAPGVMAGIRETGKNLSAMGGGIVEQIPNMVAPMGGMLLGGAAGSAAGPVGTVGGAFAGATAGNTLVESGEQVDRALQAAGINPQDTQAVQAFLKENGDKIFGQAATKGAIIGAVDTATLGAGHAILNAPVRSAVDRAIASGINPADKLAINAAVKADPIFQASQKGAAALGRNTAVGALEPAGEFTGEYLGQGVATGDWDTKGATLEALSSLGQSGITFAGQKAYQAATSPLRNGDQAPAPDEHPQTDNTMNADNAALAGNIAAYDTIPSQAPQLSYSPSVITVPTSNGSTTIDRNDGPISAAVVDTGIAQNMLSTGMPLRAFPNRLSAQQELDSRPDADRMTIAPHPRSKGSYAVVPKDRLTLNAIDEAAARSAQLEQEDGNAAQVDATGNAGPGSIGTGGAGNTSAMPGVGSAGGGNASASTPGAGTTASVGTSDLADTALAAEAAQSELTPSAAQPVASMPGVVARYSERIAQARAEAEARGATLVDEEASTAHPSPSEAQINAGNYKKGHIKVGPLDVSVENPIGSTRSGKEGKKSWQTTMQAHYGYVKRTVGADGDQVDVFVKEGTASDYSGPVFVVDQFNPKTGRFDEHKAMLGYRSQAEAAKAYDDHFGDKSGPKRRKSVVAMPMESFAKWAKEGDTTSPLSQAGKQADQAQAEIEQSTGKLSRQRVTRNPGESQTDFEYRRAAEANASRQTARDNLAETTDQESLTANVGDAEVVSAKDLPNQSETNGLSRQTAQSIELLASLFKKKVVFFRGDNKPDGFWNQGNALYLNADSAISQIRVLGHEMLHALKAQNAVSYKTMMDAIGQYLTDAELVAQFKDYFSMTDGKKDWTDAQITSWLGDQSNRDMMTEEWVADLSGNRFAEPDFWTNVFQKVEYKYGSKEAKGIISRLRLAISKVINNILSSIRGGTQFNVDSRLADNLEQIREALAEGFAKYAQATKNGATQEATGATKFSKGETAADHKMVISREERELADKTKLTRDELKKVSDDAKRFGLAPRVVEMEVRRIKARFPESAGWAPLEFLRVDKKTMNKKAKSDNPLPSDAIFFVQQPYQFHVDPATGKDNKANHDQRVKSMASALAGEIMEKYMAAQRGDQVAKVIMRQADWYRALRGKLRQVFGGFGDFFAQLLGPTSSNNPVEPNFRYASEALKAATSGQWDKLFEQAYNWRDGVITAAKNLDDTIAAVRAEGVRAAKKDPRVLQAVADLKEASKYKGDKPLRDNGKQFGVASLGIQQILADVWGDKSMGDAPKTKNYYQNIAGRTIDATIDVWAARTLRRLANDQVGNFPRIPTVAEGSVAGNVLADNVTSGSEFGFGQEVFREAAQELRNMGVELFKNTTPDAVQAMIWFAEKELWARRNWTTKIGEEGSIEHELLLAGYDDREGLSKLRVSARAGMPNRDTKAFQLKDEAKAQAKYDKAVSKWQDAKAQAIDTLHQIEKYPDRFVAGITSEIPGDKPTDTELANVGREVEGAIGDKGVMAKRAQTSTGEFMGDFERTLDTEFVARNGYDAMPVWNKLVEIAEREGQMATFLSRALRNDELESIDYTKHRPGVELYFAKPITLAEAQPLMDMINKAGVHGLTMVTDGRRTPSAVAGKDQGIVGIRMQHIPEFMVGAGYESGMSDAKIEEDIKAARDQMNDLVQELANRSDVSTVTQHWYETRVHFYGISERNSAAGSGSSGNQVWQGQRISDALADATRYDAEHKGARGTRVAQLLQERAVSRGGPESAKFSTERSDAAGNERAGGRDAQAGSAVERQAYGTAAPGAVSVQGFHYSGAERKTLDGRYYGTGAKGRESVRVNAAKDKRIKERIYFYADAGNGITPEQGVGPHGHTVNLNNLYDANADTWVQAKVGQYPTNDEWLNAFESAVIDNGFDGYVSNFGNQRAAVLVGRHNVPVSYLGIGKQSGQLSNAANQADPLANRRDLPAGRMTGAEWMKLVPEANLDPTKSYYKSDVSAAMTKLSPSRHSPSKAFGREVAPVAIKAYNSMSIDAKRIVDGWNVNWHVGQDRLLNNPAWNEVVAAFKPVRDKLRSIYGENVPAYRGEFNKGSDSGEDRFLYSWTPLRDLASTYAMNRVRGLPKEITQEQVDSQVERYKKYGIAEMVGNKYVKTTPPYGMDPEWTDYYNIYQGNELITDGTDIAEELQSEKDERDTWREELRNSGKLYFKEIPVDSIAFIPVNYNLKHPEFVAEYNPRKDGADNIKFSPARWYYSQLERSIESVPDKVFGTSTQVKLWLAGNASKLGIKKDEIEWSGINEYLDTMGKGKVSKDDVLGYLKANGVQVEEVVKGVQGYDENNPQLPPGQGLRVIEATDDTDGYEVLARNGRVIGVGPTEADAIADAYSAEPKYWENGSETRYASYTLPGGENYKELLLTLPGQKLATRYTVQGQGPGAKLIDNETGFTVSQGMYGRMVEAAMKMNAEAAGAKTPYKSSHWEEANILAHIRMNDRVDADGAKTLFIEEVQGDWQQEYRKQVSDISKQVDDNFQKIVERMKADGVLQVECD